MTTVKVYEDVTATWAAGDDESPAALSLLAEGQAMRDAALADFAAIPDVRIVDGLADWTLLIAPEIGGRLEQLARQVIASGGKLLGPSPDAIRLTSDKLALARHWESHDVPTPRTWHHCGTTLRVVNSGSQERPALPLEPALSRRGASCHETALAGPIITKPRFGAGSQDIRLGQAVQTADRIGQEFVAGFAASVAFIIHQNWIRPLIPCQQILSDDGRFTYLGGRVPIEPKLAERAIWIAMKAVECVPGLFGYVGVDVVLGDDGQDWAIEINPRLTTSYVGLRALAKFNIAAAMLDPDHGSFDWDSGVIEFQPDGSIHRS